MNDCEEKGSNQTPTETEGTHIQLRCSHHCHRRLLSCRNRWRNGVGGGVGADNSESCCCCCCGYSSRSCCPRLNSPLSHATRMKMASSNVTLGRGAERITRRGRSRGRRRSGGRSRSRGRSRPCSRRSYVRGRTGFIHLPVQH